MDKFKKINNVFGDLLYSIPSPSTKRGNTFLFCVLPVIIRIQSGHSWLFVVDCCLCVINSNFSHSYAHVCLCKSLGEVFRQHRRKQMGVFNSHKIHSLFSMCPRGWKAAESSNRDTLPHALHGKSSEIKGFVCTTNSKHCSQSLTWQNRRIKEPR